MLQIKDIRKQYITGELVQTALDGVSLNLRDNEFVAILGPSGSGKTTLLNVIGGLDRYDSGDLIINGISTKKYTDRDWDSYRNHTIGFVFQSYNLFPHWTVLDNLCIPQTAVLKRSRKGLYLRSVGESPATADAAGINVTRYRYLATIIGGGISAIGGMVYIMTIAGCVWNHEGLSGVGWLAVALVIFCLWRPLSSIWGSVLFGALMILYLRLNIPFIPMQIYKILPYVVTVIVLIVSSMRNQKENQPPEGLGLNYFREER